MEDARSRFDQGARGFAALEERQAGLIAERTRNADALPGLEQKKRVRRHSTFEWLMLGCLTLLLAFNV